MLDEQALDDRGDRVEDVGQVVAIEVGGLDLLDLDGEVSEGDRGGLDQLALQLSCSSKSSGDSGRIADVAVAVWYSMTIMVDRF